MDPELAETVAQETESVKERALHAAETAQDCASDALTAVEGYIRKNPWLMVGGALLAGAAVAALLPHRERRPDRLQAVRNWLEDACEKVSDRIPDQGDLRSLAKSCRVPSALQDLGKKLHFR